MDYFRCDNCRSLTLYSELEFAVCLQKHKIYKPLTLQNILYSIFCKHCSSIRLLNGVDLAELIINF